MTTDARGYIPVDDQLRTNVPGIWALGDCNGRGAFTHTAYNDHEIVAANLFDGGDRKVGDRVLGYALFIDPPLGRAGMTEAEARRSGRPLLIATRPMTRVNRALEKGETRGFMKVIVDAEHATHPRCLHPRYRRRRGDPRHPRHDERRPAVAGPALGRADPPDRVGADPDVAAGPQAGVVNGARFGRGALEMRASRPRSRRTGPGRRRA